MDDTQKEELQVTLTVDSSPVVPGWSFWLTHSDTTSQKTSSISPISSTKTEKVSNGSDPISKQIPTSGVSVKAESGNINIKITPGVLFRQVGWYARDPDHPESITSVNVDTGKISLQCQDDKISGTIVVQGHVLQGNRPIRIFKANGEGRRQGDQLLEMVKGVVGPRRFSGKWDIIYPQKMDHLQLTQKKSEVKGFLDEKVTIENGQVAKDIFQFNWSDPTPNFGRGFLRNAGNGVLIGMKWAQNVNDSVPIVGVQRQLKVDNGQSTAAITPPANDGEALALRWLGQDLANADKHSEAAKVLNQVIKYYAQKAESTENDPDVQYNCLISQGMPILTLVDSSFDYSHSLPCYYANGTKKPEKR